MIIEASVIQALNLYSQEKILKPIWDIRGISGAHWLATDGLYFVETKKLDQAVIDFILAEQPHISDKAYRLLKFSGNTDRIAEYLTWYYNQYLAGEL